MKKWKIIGKNGGSEDIDTKRIIALLLQNRGLETKKEIEQFLHPSDPFLLTAKDVGVDPVQLKKGIARLKKAVKAKESIIVYADYDADGITAGTIMWETLYTLGASVMPYIPHRVEEGYGLSIKGIDAVIEQYHPTLIVTVDHGITAAKQIEYAKSKGIDVIVTDHHVKPDALPKTTIIHTTNLCGAGVSWFVSKELTKKNNPELLALAAIGTIADLVPLLGANRMVVKYGLQAMNHTSRVGLNALLSEAGLEKGNLTTFDISHVLAPRLNAMGRLVHAMDALRLLCTHQEDKAMLLARKLGLTNKERQQLTIDTSLHAKNIVADSIKNGNKKKLLFVYHDSYNQGVIGLVAGKLVEEYYLPSIVLFKGEVFSKASARSIPGFNIVEAIRSCSDLLVDVGGHPMAAGFTVETKNLEELQRRLEELAEEELTDDILKRMLRIDAEIPLSSANEELWSAYADFAPFGFGNPEPVFVTSGVEVENARLVGNNGKHLKLTVSDSQISIDCIAFGMGGWYPKLRPELPVDIAYSLDMNVWKGTRRLQLKIKDIRCG